MDESIITIGGFNTLLPEIDKFNKLKICKDLNSTPRQRGQVNMLLGNCKLKQWSTTTYLKNSQNSKHWQQMLAGIENNRNFYTVLAEMKNGQYLGKYLTVSYKSKHMFIIWSNNHSYWYLPSKLKMCPHKNLQMDVHSSFINNCKFRSN